MKTLRVTLSDIVGGTGGSGSTAVVHARYVDTSGRGRDVHLTDGTIVVPVQRSVTPGTGPEEFDFTVYANDVAPVREVDYGHLVEVSWTVVAPTGAKTSGVRRVAITDDMPSVVQLGLLATPTPVPPYTGGYVLPGELDALDGRVVVLEAGGGGGGGGVTVHNLLTGRSTADAHPTSAITGLDAALAGKATAAQGAKADTAVQPARTITAGTGLTGGGDLSANRTLTVVYGTTSTTATVGDDSRLSDARTPTAHTHTSAQVTDLTEAVHDAVAALLVGASGVALSYDDAAGTLTITGGFDPVQFSIGYNATEVATTLAASSFVTVTYGPATPSTNVGGGTFDTGTGIYTVPATGRYLILARVRAEDNMTARSVGVGVHGSNADGPYFVWRTTGAPRDVLTYQRVDSFTAGTQLRTFIYSEGGTYPLIAAALTIDRIG